MTPKQIYKNRVVGVDIGTIRTNYAIIDVRGNVIAENNFSTKDYPKVVQYVDKLTEAIVEITEANGGLGTIRSVGISGRSRGQVFDLFLIGRKAGYTSERLLFLCLVGGESWGHESWGQVA